MAKYVDVTSGEAALVDTTRRLASTVMTPDALSASASMDEMSLVLAVIPAALMILPAERAAQGVQGQIRDHYEWRSVRGTHP